MSNGSLKKVIGYGGKVSGDLNYLFGYNDIFAEVISNTNPGAGKINLVSTAVPAGYIYVLQLTTAYNNTSIASAIYTFIYGGGVSAGLVYTLSPPIGSRVISNPNCVLKEGETVYSQFFDTVAGDDLYMAIRGYKMKIS